LQEQQQEEEEQQEQEQQEQEQQEEDQVQDLAGRPGPQGGLLPPTTTIACGCGIPSQQLVLSPQQLALLTRGRVVDVVVQEGEREQGQLQEEGELLQDGVAPGNNAEGRQVRVLVRGSRW
jgi:hypothetical protein